VTQRYLDPIPEDLDPSRLDQVDAHLVAGSFAVDAGVFLTHAVGAGLEETRLVVEDAGYFSDGRGLVSGDLVGIQGGSGAVAVLSGLSAECWAARPG